MLNFLVYLVLILVKKNERDTVKRRMMRPSSPVGTDVTTEEKVNFEYVISVKCITGVRWVYVGEENCKD